MRIWDASTGQPVGVPLKGHTNWVYSVSWSPNGLTLASASGDGTVRKDASVLPRWPPAVGTQLHSTQLAHLLVQEVASDVTVDLIIEDVHVVLRLRPLLCRARGAVRICPHFLALG